MVSWGNDAIGLRRLGCGRVVLTDDSDVPHGHAPANASGFLFSPSPARPARHNRRLLHTWSPPPASSDSHLKSHSRRHLLTLYLILDGHDAEEHPNNVHVMSRPPLYRRSAGHAACLETGRRSVRHGARTPLDADANTGAMEQQQLGVRPTPWGVYERCRRTVERAPRVRSGVRLQRRARVLLGIRASGRRHGAGKARRVQHAVREPGGVQESDRGAAGAVCGGRGCGHDRCGGLGGPWVLRE